MSFPHVFYGNLLTPTIVAKCQKRIKTYYVYIMASVKNGTLYIGATNNLIKRVYEHKNNLIDGFTKRYKVRRLVYFEQTDDINIAKQREKRLKRWNRRWKIQLIEKNNPDWNDLSSLLV